MVAQVVNNNSMISTQLPQAPTASIYTPNIWTDSHIIEWLGQEGLESRIMTRQSWRSMADGEWGGAKSRESSAALP